MVDIVVGGQFGSEGKGVVASVLANQYEAHIRVGGPNAGHSFVHEGRLWKMQSVPCGWTNKDANLLIGPGAVLSLEQMEKEILAIEGAKYSVRNRLLIDPRAGILEKRHAEEEGHVSGEMHQAIGSTGEGIGACRRDRLNRKAGTFRTARMAADEGVELAGRPLASYIAPTDFFRRSKALIEGTQGFGLSLIHGEWPFTTSCDPTAGSIAAECGYGPREVGEVIMVCRSMPIRVAGNSGPLFRETTWDDLSKRLGRPVLEQTTVTKKVRRIGEFDWTQFDRACRVNTPTQIVLTFADYINPADHMVTKDKDLSVQTRMMIDEMERKSNVPVTMVGTGFTAEKGWVYVDRR